MTEKQMTEQEFEGYIKQIYPLFFNDKAQRENPSDPIMKHFLTTPFTELATMFYLNKSFFIKFYSTELRHAQNASDSVFNPDILDKLNTGGACAIDFALGVISQDPRFNVFYTKEQFGQYIFDTHYGNQINKDLQSFVKVDYEKLAESEFANNINTIFIYRNQTNLQIDRPSIILVLKNEYHDYYDQLK